MLHDILRDMTASFNARSRIDNIFSIVKYGSDNVFHIDEIISDVLISRLNGVTRNVLYTPLPDFYDEDTSVTMMNSKPIELIDGIEITIIDRMMYMYHPTMDLSNVQSIMFMIGKGDEAVRQGISTDSVVSCDDDQTMICIDKDGKIVDRTSIEPYVYMIIDYESVEITNPGLYYDDTHCMSNVGILVNDSGLFDVATQIDNINDYTVMNNHAHGRVILFCDRIVDTFYRKNFEYIGDAVTNVNSYRYNRDSYIDEMVSIVSTDADIYTEMDNIKSKDFGLYYNIMYGITSLVSDINYRISELTTTESAGYNDFMWDAVKSATPKIIIPVYNPDGGAVEIYFNNRLIVDFFHVPGGSGWDTVFIGVDKLYDNIAIRNYDKDRLLKWFDALSTKHDDIVNISIRRSDFHIYSDNFDEYTNGYTILPDGWNEWYDKRITLNGIRVHEDMYDIETALDGTAILFIRHITKPGDTVAVTYYDNPIIYTETDIALDTHIVIPFGLSDELWVNGARMNKNNFEVLSSNDVMIYSDVDLSIGKTVLKHIAYEHNDFADRRTDDYNYNMLRADDGTFERILAHPSNVSKKRILPELGELWSEYVYDVHRFYTLYGSNHVVVNFDNMMPARAEELIAKHTDEFDRLIYNSNEDVFPRDMTIPGGQLELLDTFHNMLNRLHGDGFTELDANIDISSMMTDDERLIFGDVIPTMTGIYIREKNAIPTT